MIRQGSVCREVKISEKKRKIETMRIGFTDERR